jgi:hypothetical protein
LIWSPLQAFQIQICRCHVNKFTLRKASCDCQQWLFVLLPFAFVSALLH